MQLYIPFPVVSVGSRRKNDPSFSPNDITLRLRGTIDQQIIWLRAVANDEAGEEMRGGRLHPGGIHTCSGHPESRFHGGVCLCSAGYYPGQVLCVGKLDEHPPLFLTTRDDLLACGASFSNARSFGNDEFCASTSADGLAIPSARHAVLLGDNTLPAVHAASFSVVRNSHVCRH
jgi:hypothetical protein